MTQNNYDFIIVGGGPAGIMTAYKLNKENPSKTILLLEKNEKTLSDYKNIKGYNDIFKWSQAQNDPDFQYLFASEENKSVWMGKGLGGGTLHFGLQYIDSDYLIQKDFSEWTEHSGENIINAVNTITEAQKYNYTTQGPSSGYDELKTKIDNNDQADWYNNKIYSKDTTAVKTNRLLLGELIENNNEIDVEYGITIKKVNFVKKSNKKQIKSVEDFNEKKYYGNRIILCAGAIQTPAILQRSLIETEIQDGVITSNCGNKLYDHAGFYLMYAKKEQPNLSFTLNQDNLVKLNEYTTNKYIFKVTRPGGIGDNNVYDFTQWANDGNHPNGNNSIRKWVLSVDGKGNAKYELIYPHGNGTYNWNRGQNYRTLIGVFGSEINYDDLPANIKSDDLKNALFTQQEPQEQKEPIDLGFKSNEIISHIQSRDEDLKWQVYYSIIPNNENSIVLTFAQSTNLSESGKVLINDLDNNEIPPSVRLEHFGPGTIDSNNNEFINDLYNAFTINNTIMKDSGFQLYDYINQQFIPSDIFVTKEWIKNNYISIYHYHGTCQDIVDDTQKVNNTNNLYIGDISVLNKPWGGSTSFPALVTGYLVAKNISKDIENGDINGDKKIGIEDLNLVLKDWSSSQVTILNKIVSKFGSSI